MKRSTVLALLASVFLLASCAGLTQLAAFSKCSFEFEKVENVQLAAIDINKASSLTQLSFLDVGKITRAVLAKELMLDMTALIKVKNPNTQTAALNKTDWVLKIDGLEITRGTTNQRVEVPANGAGYLPVKTSFNLAKTFSGESKTKLYNLARNIAGVGDSPSKIEFMVKPTLSVAGVLIPYPNWITLERKIGAKQ